MILRKKAENFNIFYNALLRNITLNDKLEVHQPFYFCTVHIDLIHFIFTNLCTCISVNINANTLQY